MPILRRKPKAAEQASYERARGSYRRSLWSFVGSVMAGILVLGIASPLISRGFLDDSQVFDGPVYPRYGMGMLPIDAYGVDINSEADIKKKEFVNRSDATIRKVPLLGDLVKPKDVGAREVRTAADIRAWDLSPDNSDKPLVKAYILPDFLVLGKSSTGEVRAFRAGDKPIYVSMKSLSLGENGTLDDLKWSPDSSSNMLGSGQTPALPFRMVFSKSAAAGGGASPVASAESDKKVDLYSQSVSPVFTSDEAYVYFSPQSAYEQYIALKAEYDSRRPEYEVAKPSPRVLAESGMYMATIMVLEGYLNETLPQDGTRGWNTFNVAAWGQTSEEGPDAKRLKDLRNKLLSSEASGDFADTVAVNNMMRAASTSGGLATFSELRGRSTPYHLKNTDAGVFIPPTHPIQSQVMPKAEDAYRFQILSTVGLKEITAAALLNGGGKAEKKHAAQLANNNLQSAGIPTIAMAIGSSVGGWNRTMDRFYSPIKPQAPGGDVYLSRVSISKNAVITPAFPFMGYTPIGGKSAGDGGYHSSGGAAAVSQMDSEESRANPAAATSTMFFAVPTFAPSIASKMGDDQHVSVLNAELYGLYSVTLTRAVAADTLVAGLPGWAQGLYTGFSKWRSANTENSNGRNISGDAAGLIAAVVTKGGVPNKVGWAYSETYNANDQAAENRNDVSDPNAQPVAALESTQTPGIEGNRASTGGKRAAYTVEGTADRIHNMAEAGAAVPYGDLFPDLENAATRHMDMQGYTVDTNAIALGSLGKFGRGFEGKIARLIATPANWLLMNTTKMFVKAFSASASFSGVGSGPLSFGGWRNPFTILVSTPGLGAVYGTVQVFSLMFVILFTLWLGVSMIIAGTGDGIWPIDLSSKEATLKGAIPRVFVSVLMIGLPVGMNGGKIFPGLGYYVASFILFINDAICNILGSSVSVDFLSNLTKIYANATQSVVSAVVFSLVAMVMSMAFSAGVIMLVLRTLSLYLLMLACPLVWAFWVLGGDNKGEFEMMGGKGNKIPQNWLKAFTATAFMQVFWVVAFFLMSSLFTSENIVASIFGMKGMSGAGAATAGMMPAAFAANSIVTGAVTGADLLAKAILVVVLFFLMAMIAAPLFKSALGSGVTAVSAAGGALKDTAKKGYRDATKKVSKYGEAGLKGGKGIKDMAKADARAVESAAKRKIAQASKAASSAAKAGKGVVGAVKDPKAAAAAAAAGVKSKADTAKDATARKTAEFAAAAGKHTTGKAGSLAAARDRRDFDRKWSDAAKTLSGQGGKPPKDETPENAAIRENGELRQQRKWAGMSQAERDAAVTNSLGESMELDADGRTGLGMAADGTFAGTDGERGKLAANELWEAKRKELGLDPETLAVAAESSERMRRQMEAAKDAESVQSKIAAASAAGAGHRVLEKDAGDFADRQWESVESRIPKTVGDAMDAGLLSESQVTAMMGGYVEDMSKLKGMGLDDAGIGLSVADMMGEGGMQSGMATMLAEGLGRGTGEKDMEALGSMALSSLVADIATAKKGIAKEFASKNMTDQAWFADALKSGIDADAIASAGDLSKLKDTLAEQLSKMKPGADSGLADLSATMAVALAGIAAEVPRLSGGQVDSMAADIYANAAVAEVMASAVGKNIGPMEKALKSSGMKAKDIAELSSAITAAAGSNPASLEAIIAASAKEMRASGSMESEKVLTAMGGMVGGIMDRGRKNAKKEGVDSLGDLVRIAQASVDGDRPDIAVRVLEQIVTSVPGASRAIASAEVPRHSGAPEIGE